MALAALVIKKRRILSLHSKLSMTLTLIYDNFKLCLHLLRVVSISMI